MSNIRALPGATLSEAGNARVAEQLRQLAAEVERGECGNIRNIVCVVDALDRSLDLVPMGERLPAARGIGLMFLAQKNMAEQAES